MTIESEISRIQSDKASMAAAIEEKGVTVGDASLDDFASLISQIESGGSGGLDPSTFYGYVTDEGVWARIYYYPKSYNNTFVYYTDSNCTCTITDEAVAKAFVEEKTKEAVEMGMDKMIDFMYDMDQGGWSWRVEMAGEEFVGDEAAMLKLTGCTLTRTEGYNVSCGIKNQMVPLMANKLSTFDVDETCFKEFLNFGWPDSGSFTLTNKKGETAEIYPLSVVKVRFGTSWPTTEEAAATYGEEIYLESNCNIWGRADNLTYVSAMPAVNQIGRILISESINDHPGDAFYGNIIIPAAEHSVSGADYMYRCQTNFNMMFLNWTGLKSVDSNVYDFGICYNCPNLTGTIYWGKEVTYLPPKSFTCVHVGAPLTYTEGVKFTGPGAASAKALLPDLDGTGTGTAKNWRKIILV